MVVGPFDLEEAQLRPGFQAFQQRRRCVEIARQPFLPHVSKRHARQVLQRLATIIGSASAFHQRVEWRPDLPARDRAGAADERRALQHEHRRARDRSRQRGHQASGAGSDDDEIRHGFWEHRTTGCGAKEPERSGKTAPVVSISSSGSAGRRGRRRPSGACTSRGWRCRRSARRALPRCRSRRGSRSSCSSSSASADRLGA